VQSEERLRERAHREKLRDDKRQEQRTNLRRHTSPSSSHAPSAGAQDKRGQNGRQDESGGDQEHGGEGAHWRCVDMADTPRTRTLRAFNTSRRGKGLCCDLARATSLAGTAGLPAVRMAASRRRRVSIAREVERWDAGKGFGRTGAIYLRPLPRARTAPAAEGVWDAMGGGRGYCVAGFTAPSRGAARRRLGRSPPPPPRCVMRPCEAPALLVLQLGLPCWCFSSARTRLPLGL